MLNTTFASVAPSPNLTPRITAQPTPQSGGTAKTSSFAKSLDDAAPSTEDRINRVGQPPTPNAEPNPATYAAKPRSVQAQPSEQPRKGVASEAADRANRTNRASTSTSTSTSTPNAPTKALKAAKGNTADAKTEAAGKDPSKASGAEDKPGAKSGSVGEELAADSALVATPNPAAPAAAPPPAPASREASIDPALGLDGATSTKSVKSVKGTASESSDGTPVRHASDPLLPLSASALRAAAAGKAGAENIAAKDSSNWRQELSRASSAGGGTAGANAGAEPTAPAKAAPQAAQPTAALPATTATAAAIVATGIVIPDFVYYVDPPQTLAPTSATPTPQASIAAAPGSREFAALTSQQITVFAANGVEQAQLQLNPAQMGPVTVQIQLTGDQAQVHLAAEHAFTRQALEQAMPELASSLRDAGLTLTGGGVFEQPRQNLAGNNGSGEGSRSNSRGREDTTPIAPAALTGSATNSPARQRGVVDLVA
jgi:flagellar hook-length control protein FliK